MKKNKLNLIIQHFVFKEKRTLSPSSQELNFLPLLPMLYLDFFSKHTYTLAFDNAPSLPFVYYVY